MIRVLSCCLVAMVALSALASAAQAGVMTAVVQNPSFEVYGIANGGVNGNDALNWNQQKSANLNDNSAQEFGDTRTEMATDFGQTGSARLRLFGGPTSARSELLEVEGGGSLLTIAAGQTYTAQVYVAPVEGDQGRNRTGLAYLQFYAFNGSTCTLVAEQSLLIQKSRTIQPSGVFLPLDLTYTDDGTFAGQSLGLCLKFAGTDYNTNELSNDEYSRADFDSVSATYTVPEPATLTLLGMGALAIARRRRN